MGYSPQKGETKTWKRKKEKVEPAPLNRLDGQMRKSEYMKKYVENLSI